MDPRPRWEVHYEILGPDRHVYIEATLELARNGVEKIPFGASDAVAGRHVEYSHAHRGAKVALADGVVLVKSGEARRAELRGYVGTNLTFRRWVWRRYPRR